ncbi:hypothetical protein D7B24_001436 [Verticillium nonalfalfae]|uniref:Cell wall protein n=2 Tax=Verticillium TaxID=1036719 RepID=C9SIY0_VERA1|nr:hypothetical protein VDBG_05012 [Verticillium alfalfae VaMs.102]XP_028497871.1 uncharacterized protein D7B24_001436 [Verticillium nonalfalfae]EEY18903.1 hypothetical protein VDBG_05012 [Verticillium alfalfae VaMs.102]RNJ59713.1 hypothetical protein D7B24_001436 [Verticillium nonalfalfae]
MKFLSILSLVSFASAAPALQARQNTAIGTVKNAVATLDSATKGNIQAIQDAVAEVKNNVEAQVEVVLKTNIQGIADALKKATDDIVKGTTGAGGAIGGDLKDLTQAQINEVRDAIAAAQRILRDIGATVRLTATDLTPALKSAIQSEVDAVKAAIQPFVTPLTTFGEAAKAARASLAVGITGLSTVIAELGGILSRLIASIGL